MEAATKARGREMRRRSGGKCVDTPGDFDANADVCVNST